MNSLTNQFNRSYANLKSALKETSSARRVIIMIIIKVLIFALLPIALQSAVKMWSKYSDRNKCSNRTSPQGPANSLLEARIIQENIHKKHAIDTLYDVDDAVSSNGECSRLYNVKNAHNLNLTIDRLRDFRSINGGKIFNHEVLNRSGPVEELVYECMVIVELSMEQSHATQYKNIDNNSTQDSKKDLIKPTEKDLQKEVHYVFNLLIKNLQKNEKKIRTFPMDIEGNTYKTLLNIQRSYISKMNSKLNIQPKYADEFLKNLNIMLYMIHKEDFSSIDRKFIHKFKSQLSTCFSDEETVDLVKKDSAVTVEQSQQVFLRNLKKIIN